MFDYPTVKELCSGLLSAMPRGREEPLKDLLAPLSANTRHQGTMNPNSAPDSKQWKLNIDSQVGKLHLQCKCPFILVMLYLPRSSQFMQLRLPDSSASCFSIQFVSISTYDLHLRHLRDSARARDLEFLDPSISKTIRRHCEADDVLAGGSSH